MKGYYMYGLPFKDKEEAKREAKKLRERGYYARVKETTTAIRGFHEWIIYVKRKGGW